MKKTSLIPFRKLVENETGIVDSGSLGDLFYEIHKRGVIHIFDKDKTMIFKKDPDIFEKAIEALNLHTFNADETKTIKGSGDNDDLVFQCINGDIEIRLEKKTFGMIDKLKKVIGTAKNSAGK
jgi:hypothetical protein